jgi:PDZ domain-containing protein
LVERDESTSYSELDDFSGSDSQNTPSDGTPRSSLKSVWFEKVPKKTTRMVLVLMGFCLMLMFSAVLSEDSGFGTLGPGPVVKISNAFSGSALKSSESSKDPTAAENPQDSDGWFAFTTVEIKELSYAELFWARIVNTKTIKLSNLSTSAPAKAQMSESKETALRLALSIVSKKEFEVSGLLIVSVLKDSPAEISGFEAGDIIVSANSERLNSPVELREVISSSKTSVQISYKREGVLYSLKVSPLNGRIGVAVVPSYKESLDGILEVETGSVGGPSAGLLLTLAAIDVLSPGDLTANLNIAGTGTIDPERNVGPIAGVEYKSAAAEKAGADVFFVPRSEASKVPKNLTLKVISVDTLEEALEYLCASGATDEACNGI